VLTLGRRLGPAAPPLAAWVVAAVCLCSASALAQQPAGNTAPPATTGTGAPTGSSATNGGHAPDPNGRPPGKAAEDVPGHTGGGHIADPHHAEQEQQALHEAIKEKFKEFDAAMKKGVTDRAAALRRQEATRQVQAHAPAPTAGPAPAPANPPATTAAAAKPAAPPAVAQNASASAIGHIMAAPNRVAQHPLAVPPQLPGPERQAAVVEAPKFPHVVQPPARSMGGPAPYDPKKSALLAGSTVRHRL
jgi:hypothetical protein